jgi:hypothetical protein
MTKCLTALLVSIALLMIWIVTYMLGEYPGQGHSYFQVAPWWHIGLQVAWAISVGITGVYSIYWYWDSRSRRKELTHQPPYQTHR